MTDRSKQIIPDSEAVVHCLAPEILEILDSHTTFVIQELLETIKISEIDRTSFRDELIDMITKSTQGAHNKEIVLNKLIAFIEGDKIEEGRYTSYEILRKELLNGTECCLLQSDGKGWQKGKIKICFEFIPEEDETIASQEKPVETNTSPLDEIRQLSNELMSVGSIEQN
jgi:KGK domain